MSLIRNFNNIHEIRKEIRRIQIECRKEINAFAAIKRLLLNQKDKITAASFVTRDAPSTPVKPVKRNKIQYAAIEKLSNMLGDRQERQELAEHIHFLLKNHFNNEDGAVIKKLTELSKQLVEETTNSSKKADAALSDQGAKLTPKDFKTAAEEIGQELSGEFDTPPEKIQIKYYIGIDKTTVEGKNYDRLYNMAYISVPSFKANDNIRDLLIVMTRRTDAHNNQKNYIRTFTNYINPAALMKTNIGIEFTEPKRAFDIVMTNLKMDKIIDVIHPSQIPVKKNQFKVNNKNVMNQQIDYENGVISIYLNPTIKTQAEAERVLHDIFVETRNIIKSVHPRNKNPIKATVPKIVKATHKEKSGKSVKVEQYKFKIMFSKPENEKSVELPRNKIAQFMRVMDIDNKEAAHDFNLLLKKFAGVSTKT